MKKWHRLPLNRSWPRNKRSHLNGLPLPVRWLPRRTRRTRHENKTLRFVWLRRSIDATILFLRTFHDTLVRNSPLLPTRRTTRVRRKRASQSSNRTKLRPSRSSHVRLRSRYSPTKSRRSTNPFCQQPLRRAVGLMASLLSATRRSIAICAPSSIPRRRSANGRCYGLFSRHYLLFSFASGQSGRADLP